MKKHELEARVAQLEAEVEAARTGMLDLRAYLQSEKFWSDSSVNTADVLTRLSEIWSDVIDVEMTPYGLAMPVNREKAWRDENMRPHFVGITDDGYVAYRPRYLEGYDLRREVAR